MHLQNEQPIGTNFKKENIFLATFLNCNSQVKDLVESTLKENFSEELTSSFIDSSIISTEECDIFYKDDNGYTRFLVNHFDTFVGDDSDGKGVLRNIVSAWDYFSEDQLIELTINDSIGIAICDEAPLKKYNEDYNLKNK